MKLRWNGKQVSKNVEAAAKRGIDKTMAAAVISAKRGHGGWKNRTGAAEASVRIVQFAKRYRKGAVGIWGSADIDYVIWLELKHGSFLRNAAARNYRRLAANIRAAL